MHTQEEFLKLAHDGHNIFLSGVAGSGKTYILKKFIEDFGGTKVVVAPTGIAAINVGGSTIHSAFKIYGGNKFSKQVINWKGVRLLVIDEISMVSNDLFNNIDYFLRGKIRADEPLGGLQVIICGDFKQLPPVNGESITIPDYFHNIFLSENKRSDDKLTGILNKLRDQEKVSDLIQTGKGDDSSTHLFYTNKECNTFNKMRLGSIDNEEYKFVASITGKFNKNEIITEEEIHLKVGCRVMITTNLENGLVNGDTGYVTEISEYHIAVESDRFSKEFLITKHIFKKIESDAIIGTFIQFPLKLAYGITIHKSQGLSLDNVVFHYYPGMSTEMIYVALSRCTTYEHLYLFGN